MSVSTIKIKTLGELIDRVTPDKPDPRTGRRRDPGVYRGTSDPEAPLFTSLDRLGDQPHSKCELESHILRNFIRYSRPFLGREPANDWEHLVTAQHHGVPTRLLDWTYSPLVAAFFATRPVDGAERDRAVWRLDWQRVHRHFRFPSLALLIEDLEALASGSDARPFTPWKLFASRNGTPFACMIEPPSFDARIVAQAATFTLTSTTAKSFDGFLESLGLAESLTRYVIAASDVARIRDQLDLVGIDERRLFPDLDGVASAIQRYYG